MKKILFASALAILFFSCKENKSENLQVIDNAIDNTGSLKASSLYSRDINMVYQIYGELLKNDQKLKTLDDKIKNINEETEKVISPYDNILGKTEMYYENANALTRAIHDSILKTEIEKEIKASSEKYHIKIKRIRDLIREVNKNREQLHDQYVAFQIKKTLPEIEKYQNAHPLKTDDLDHFINKQNQLLNELKNLK